MNSLYHTPYDQLKAFYLFLVPNLSDESWSKFEELLTIREYKKGDLIIKEGRVCENVSFVNSGYLRLYTRFGDRDVTKCFLGNNNYIADYPSFLTRKPAKISVQALTNVVTVDTSFADLQRAYQEIPEANLLGRLIAENLFIRMQDDHDLEAKTSIEQRYINLLNEQPWVAQHVPQYMIASYLGITPEALSRVKGRMNKKRQPA